jgi:hypothetical protein
LSSIDAPVTGFVIRVLSSREERLVQNKLHNKNQLTTKTDVSIVLWPGTLVRNKRVKVNTEETRQCQTIKRWQRKFQSSEGPEETY